MNKSHGINKANRRDALEHLRSDGHIKYKNIALTTEKYRIQTVGKKGTD